MFPTTSQMNVRGTRTIYCPQCKERICEVTAETFFGSALCVVCQAANRGETLPLHIIAQMRSSTTDVTFSDVGYDPLTEKYLNTEEHQNLISSADYWFKTIRVKAKAAIDAIIHTKVKRVKELPSTKMAKEKRRKRLFDGPIDPK